MCGVERAGRVPHRPKTVTCLELDLNVGVVTGAWEFTAVRRRT